MDRKVDFDVNQNYCCIIITTITIGIIIIHMKPCVHACKHPAYAFTFVAMCQSNMRNYVLAHSECDVKLKAEEVTRGC